MQILNSYSEAELGRMIREYGEEKSWRTVARRWVEVGGSTAAKA